MDLIRTPDWTDSLGDACYTIDQTKGLFEETDYGLMARQTHSGYTQMVADVLFQEVASVVSGVAQDRSLRVLEIGGGPGQLFDRIDSSVGSYVNVEPGRQELAAEDLARRRDPRYMRIACSGQDVPLPDSSFDVAICVASLDHIPSPTSALSEIQRLLADGGVFVMTLNNRASWWKRLLSRTRYLRRRETRIARSHFIQWSTEEASENVSRYLEVTRLESMIFLPFIPRVWRYLLPVADALGRNLSPLRGANTFLVARRGPRADATTLSQLTSESNRSKMSH